MDKDLIKALAGEALRMRGISYAPYSHYRVGAALLGKSGKVYSGCNIENAAYSPTVCAERTAFFKAVSEGEKEFTAIAVTGGSGEEPSECAAPCGVCRQVMMEFCDPETFILILVKDTETYEICTLGEILPRGFGPGSLMH